MLNSGGLQFYPLYDAYANKTLQIVLTSKLVNDILELQTKLGKGDGKIMDRDEILKKAQSEQNDEMRLQVQDKSMKWTYIAMVAAAAIFAYIRSEQGMPMMDLCATVCFSVFVGQFYRFLKIKEKNYLLLAVITLLLAIFSTVRFVMGH